MKVLHYILATLIIFGSSTLFSQKTKVYGVVKDATSGETLPFVNVFFKDSKIGTTTNIDGEYSLETYYATDSISATFIGYEKLTYKIKKDISQEINFDLTESISSLPELVVLPSEENPAHPIMRKVINNKKINNREKLEAYQYEVYNKIELDLNNMDEDFRNKKLFKKFDFIFDNIDSSDNKPFLPVFISESLSDFYYRKSPKAQKEFIKATSVSGLENESVAQFTGDMYQNVNIYDNSIYIFGKNFISPVANTGLAFYKYYLLDSLNVDGSWCYELQFKPKRKGELTFEGTLWINDTTYAVKKVDTRIAQDANVNFVNDMKVVQTFNQVENEVWMLTKDELYVDFELAKNQMGFYGRKMSSYKNFVINKPEKKEFYQGADRTVVLDSSQHKSAEFWKENRHDSLTANQEGVYTMIDTLGNLPIIRTYVDILQTIFTGYKILGKVELGPYFSLYSYNEVEGHRFRFGGRTSNDFSKKIEFSGYGAYGLLDKEFKYGVGTRFFIKKKPRRLVKLVYKHDVEQLGISSNAFNSANLVTSFARRNKFNKMVFNTEYRGSYELEWFQGLTSTILFRNTTFSPLGITPFNLENPDSSLTPVDQLTSSEISFHTRFAFNEEFVAGEFDRVSLGTRYPILTAQYTYGVPNLFESSFEFHKAIFGVKHRIPLGFLGTFHYQVNVGKIWGKLPYPMLEIHAGNETWYYNDDAFNMMNIGEFVSDEYVTFNFNQHFEGLFLNKIPVMRKLKWREVAGIKGVWGRLSEQNLAEMQLPYFSSSLQDKPYLEFTAGIENIFKFLRFDVLWRMTYLDNTHNDIRVGHVGVRGKLMFDF